MIRHIGIVFFLGLIWWGITQWTSMPPFLLPPPEQVIQSFMNHGSTIAYHTAFSFMEIMAGLGLGLMTSLMITFLLAQRSSWIAPILSFFTAFQAIPIFALLPLLILWMGHGVATKIFVISLACFFPITIGALNGLSRIPGAYYDLSFLFHGRAWYRFRHVELPALLPHLMIGFRLAAVHAPVTVIAADWIGATQGLGYLIMLTSGRLQVDLLFAGIICLICLSLSLNRGCNVLNKKIIYWPSES
jgi:putative hydroxymethylpyrimidine transport system permease protein